MSWDFRLSPGEQDFRKEVRDFILAEIPQELRWSERTAFTDALWPMVLEARRGLARKGWATMHWPVEHGGLGASHVTQTLLMEEMAYLGVPQAIAFDDGPNLIGPALIRFGSDRLKSVHLPAIASAETFWCQAYTEPEGGSDLASVSHHRCGGRGPLHNQRPQEIHRRGGQGGLGPRPDPHQPGGSQAS